jgi:hypothetical protein
MKLRVLAGVVRRFTMLPYGVFDHGLLPQLDSM